MVLSLLRVSYFYTANFYFNCRIHFYRFLVSKGLLLHKRTLGAFKEGTKRHITFAFTIFYDETLGQPVLS